jgi:hypothetical protein
MCMLYFDETPELIEAENFDWTLSGSITGPV